MNLIYQVAVGDTNSLYETCIRSVARYCARYGIEHRVQRDPILRIQPRGNHRSQAASRLGYLPIYEKENAFDLLPQYPAVCVIDSDVYITDQAPDIFAVPRSAPFAGVIERDMPLTPRHSTKVRKYSRAQYDSLRAEADFGWTEHGTAFFNMGVMLLDQALLPWLRGESAQQFLARPVFQRFVDGEGSWRWSTDQTLLNYWLRSEQIPVQELDWRWNTLYGAVTSEAAQKAWFLHFFLAQHHVGDRDIQDVIQSLVSC